MKSIIIIILFIVFAILSIITFALPQGKLKAYYGSNRLLLIIPAVSCCVLVAALVCMIIYILSKEPISPPQPIPSPQPQPTPSPQPQPQPTPSPQPQPQPTPSPQPQPTPVSNIIPAGEFNMLRGNQIGNFKSGFQFQWTNGGNNYEYFNPISNSDPSPLKTQYNGLYVLEYNPTYYTLNLDSQMALLSGSVKRPRIELNHIDDEYITYDELKNYSFSGEFKMITTTQFGKINASNNKGLEQSIVIFQIFNKEATTVVEVSVSYYEYAKDKDGNTINTTTIPFIMVNYNTITSGNDKYRNLTLPNKSLEDGSQSFTLDVNVTDNNLVISSNIDKTSNSLSMALTDVFNNQEPSKLYFKTGAYGQIPYDTTCCTNMSNTKLCSLQVYKSQLTYSG